MSSSELELLKARLEQDLDVVQHALDDRQRQMLARLIARFAEFDGARSQTEDGGRCG